MVEFGWRYSQAYSIWTIVQGTRSAAVGVLLSTIVVAYASMILV